MPKKQKAQAKVLITDVDLGGFLDMLRYDGCTVLRADHVESSATSRARYGAFDVTLLSADNRTTGFEFTPDRWASFGLTLRDIQPWRGY